MPASGLFRKHEKEDFEASTFEVPSSSKEVPWKNVFWRGNSNAFGLKLLEDNRKDGASPENLLEKWATLFKLPKSLKGLKFVTY